MTTARDLALKDLEEKLDKAIEEFNWSDISDLSENSDVDEYEFSQDDLKTLCNIKCFVDLGKKNFYRFFEEKQTKRQREKGRLVNKKFYMELCGRFNRRFSKLSNYINQWEKQWDKILYSESILRRKLNILHLQEIKEERDNEVESSSEISFDFSNPEYMNMSSDFLSDADFPKNASIMQYTSDTSESSRQTVISTPNIRLTNADSEESIQTDIFNPQKNAFTQDSTINSASLRNNSDISVLRRIEKGSEELYMVSSLSNDSISSSESIKNRNKRGNLSKFVNAKGKYVSSQESNAGSENWIYSIIRKDDIPNSESTSTSQLSYSDFQIHLPATSTQENDK